MQSLVTLLADALARPDHFNPKLLELKWSNAHDAEESGPRDFGSRRPAIDKLIAYAADGDADAICRQRTRSTGGRSPVPL